MSENSTEKARGIAEKLEPTVIKLWEEGEEQLGDDRTAYEIFTQKVFDLGKLYNGWYRENGTWAYFVHTTIRKERVRERIEEGDYRDFTPNEERLAYFSAFLELVEKMNRRDKLVQQAIEKLEAAQEVR